MAFIKQYREMNRILFIIFLLTCTLFVRAQENNLYSLQPSQKWDVSAWIGYYLMPNANDFALPILYAEHKAFHGEIRYNYEAMQTASVFGGYMFETGKELSFKAIPMIGYVFGKTNAIAPGLEMELAYKRFDFYSESEYLFDFSGKQNNYLYTYTELGYSFNKALRAGYTSQRTRLYQSALNLQQGVFINYKIKQFEPGFKTYNLFTDSYFFVFTLNVKF